VKGGREIEPTSGAEQARIAAVDGTDEIDRPPRRRGRYVAAVVCGAYLLSRTNYRRPWSVQRPHRTWSGSAASFGARSQCADRRIGNQLDRFVSGSV
jgi:hypothetical protein